MTDRDRIAFDAGVRAYHSGYDLDSGNPWAGTAGINRAGYIWRAGWEHARSLGPPAGRVEHIAGEQYFRDRQGKLVRL